MIIINFSHPLTELQRNQIEVLTGQPISKVYNQPCQFTNDFAYSKQIVSLVDKIGLSITSWQTSNLLINPPAYGPIAAVLIAELHGRMGYFPKIIRISPVLDSTPPQFKVAEIIILQTVRDIARRSK